MCVYLTNFGGKKRDSIIIIIIIMSMFFMKVTGFDYTAAAAATPFPQTGFGFCLLPFFLDSQNPYRPSSQLVIR